MLSERELQISPLVQDSIVHNTKVRTSASLLFAASISFPVVILATEPLFIHLPMMMSMQYTAERANAHPSFQRAHPKPPASYREVKLSLMTNARRTHSSSIPSSFTHLPPHHIPLAASRPRERIAS